MAFALKFTEDVVSFHVGTFIGGGKQPASGHPNTKLAAPTLPSNIEVFLKDIESDAEVTVCDRSPSLLFLLIHYSHQFLARHHGPICGAMSNTIINYLQNEMGDFPGQSIIPVNLQAISKKCLEDGYLIHDFHNVPASFEPPLPSSAPSGLRVATALGIHSNQYVCIPLDGSKSSHPGIARNVSERLSRLARVFRVSALEFTQVNPANQPNVLVLHFQHPLLVRVLITALTGFAAEFLHLRDLYRGKRLSRLALISTEAYVSPYQLDVRMC